MRIPSENSIALIIDVQEKLFPYMDERDHLLEKLVILIEGLKALQVSCILTQQYTKGLGPSIAELYDHLGSGEFFEKISFSCWDDVPIMNKIKNENPLFVLVAGIESHVCVLQTCIDLKTAGYQPVFIADASSSRKKTDKELALFRLYQEGVLISSVEAILFELTRFAGTDLFKKISKCVK